MSSSVNKVLLIGHLGRDPEVRYNPDGSKIVRLSLATSESWKDKVTGESKERTEWHRVVVFNERLTEICEKYLHKGSKVYLEGQVQTRKWTDNNTGQEKTVTEVVLQKYRGEITMLDSRNDSSGKMLNASVETAPVSGEVLPPSYDLDDEIPF